MFCHTEYNMADLPSKTPILDSLLGSLKDANPEDYREYLAAKYLHRDSEPEPAKESESQARQ
jgi:hypothetical protein